MKRISCFDLQVGDKVAGKYVVEGLLGSGWEGEVYRVRERQTGVRRALKLFFPQRNPRGETLRRYAKKLDRLRRCPVVIQYVHSETLEFDGQVVTGLISELVEGELLRDHLRSRRKKRMERFEALHLAYALALGLEQIHAAKLYHGDLHDGNILLERQGIFIRPRIVDFFHRGATRRAHIQNDVVDVTRLLYDAVGGRAGYEHQPPYIKNICCGLRSDLVRRRFPTATHLRRHLEHFPWE